MTLEGNGTVAAAQTPICEPVHDVAALPRVHVQAGTPYKERNESVNVEVTLQESEGLESVAQTRESCYFIHTHVIHSFLFVK